MRKSGRKKIEPDHDLPQHELSNVHLRQLIIVTVIGAVVIFVAMAAVVGLFWGFEAIYQERLNPEPLTYVEIEKPYLEPFVLAGAEELVDLRLQENLVLESYAWVDRERGMARIPLERAFEIVASEGLPEWSPPATQPAQ